MQYSTTNVERKNRVLWSWIIPIGLLIAPIILLFLRLVPRYDLLLHSAIGHFWIVLAAVIAALLMVGLIIQAGIVRRDGRVFIIGIGFLVLSLMFLVHAVATPGVVFSNTAQATAWSTPLALIATATIFAFSTSNRVAEWIMARWRRLLIVVMAMWVGYVVVMLGYLPRHLLDANQAHAAASYADHADEYEQSYDPNYAKTAPTTPQPDTTASPRTAVQRFVDFAPTLFPWITAVSIGLFGYTAWRYGRLWRVAPTLPLACFTIAAVLLAEAALAAQFGVTWQLSFWLYHVLLLVAVLTVTYGSVMGVERTGSLTSAVEGLLLGSTLQRQQFAFNNAMQVLLNAFESGDQDRVPVLRRDLREQFALAEDQLDLLEHAVKVVAQDRQQTQRLQALVDMSQTMTLELAPEILIERVLRSLVRTTEPSLAAVGLVEGDSLVIHAKHRFVNGVASNDDLKLNLAYVPHAWFAVTDIAYTTPLNAFPQLAINDDEAWVFPLLHRTELIGVLFFQPQATLEGRLEHVLQSLAAHLATALSNSNLYRQLQREHDNLQRSERIREQFNQMIVHDLKNPLTAIINYLDLIRRSEHQDKESTELLINGARRSSRVMMGLVMDLLDTARLQEGQLILKSQPYNLAALMHETAADFRPWAKEEQKTIQVVVEDPLVWMNIDGDLFKRVLTNLVANAIKHTPPQTTITLSTEQTADSLRILVRDNGYGIPEEQQSMLFERFAAVESINMRRYRSTGLGLYFCKLVVEQHGGNIRVHSKPQQGATFEISLPISLIVSQDIPEVAA